MKNSNIIFSIIGVTFIGLIVLLSTTIFSPEISNFFDRTEFDSEEWKNWKETENEQSLRWNMVHDLKSKYELVGMNAKEIKELLGKPNRENKNFLSYHLGMSGHGIDTGTLYLELKNEIVVEVEIWHG